MEMISVYPEFYEHFFCKAGDCRHSCCKGWEIDVDEETADYYDTIDDPIGDEIRASLVRDEDGIHFKLTDEMRCPFLRDDGLCRMILALGEDALCDICALHPRFYEDYDGYELCGLGLSCERVCELLWESDKALMFYCDGRGEDKKTPFSFAEQSLSYEPKIDMEHIKKLLLAYEKTEPIDEAWTDTIITLKEDLEEVVNRARAYKDRYDKKRYDRLYHYIIYRQLGTKLSGHRRVAFAQMAADYIFITDAYHGDTLECIRRFSEQIEYSTDNIDILIGEKEGYDNQKTQE